jgi:hypothetical protein
MPGGLLNLISEGNNNVFLTGSPTKTFFTVSYSKYTNFGLQKFRLDYDGTRDLRLTTDSTFKFKVKRYAELLMDTYLVVTLPDIWSPLYPPVDVNGNPTGTNGVWAPYDFRWIKEIGSYIIRDVTIQCGNATLQKYTGEYLAAMVDRDFSAEKKDLYNRMTGNIDELNDPANAYCRNNCYPSAYYTPNTAGAEPSIRSRTLYIPINTWFTLDSRCAFPLVSLQYNELEIVVTLRPIQELFQIRDVFDSANKFPYIQADLSRPELQVYRFLQTPPSIFMDTAEYLNQTNTWNADIHLISTYCFLSKDEAQLFAAKDQIYLVKDVYQYNFQNISGTTRVKLTSTGMISNWMMYLQRNDVNLRNEWSNYTNWPYAEQPQGIIPAPSDISFNTAGLIYGPQYQADTEVNSGLFITGDFSQDNQKDILLTMGILLNGEYRENTLTRGIFDYIEKYTRTQGTAKDGLYCYNFCLNTSPFEYQPSGALNMSKFKNIEIELSTYIPTIDKNKYLFEIICDICGNAIGINKQSWRHFEYTYNLTVFEERYNILSFIGGNCGMLYAR